MGLIANDRHPFQFFFSYTRSIRILFECRCPVLQVYIHPNCHYSRGTLPDVPDQLQGSTESRHPQGEVLLGQARRELTSENTLNV